MQNMSVVLQQRSEKRRHEDDEEVFGKMIGNKLRTFPKHMKFFVKQELNNVIFKYKYQLQSKATQQMSNLHMAIFK